MLKIENTEVMGWEAAIRGMRNPMNSWEKSDSFCHPTLGHCNDCSVRNKCAYIFEQSGKPYRSGIGPEDLDLMTRLRNAGTDHRKYMRMITVYLDITAPLYWWKEFDTYKVGTVANSCSTMHKITAKEFTLEDFSCEHLMDEDDVEWGDTVPMMALLGVVNALNVYRWKYLNAKTKPMKEEAKRKEVMKKYWWQMIQLLPSSYNQRRTILLNYEVLANIYKSRRNHKLDEWHTFCDWIEALPYSELITGKTE